MGGNSIFYINNATIPHELERAAQEIYSEISDINAALRRPEISDQARAMLLNRRAQLVRIVNDNCLLHDHAYSNREQKK